ncbi:MAG TPA: GAF domain-containing sensor histidine kinase [Steroidobacteraceae bacterium]|nr:GAF domain-containing sensor histidine kinase [Steroidobacteraceae bacterium]
MSINPVDLAAAAEGILNTQYLQQRERLLGASAQASRLLLESPDAMKVMPEVLRLLGEAAQVDRTALAFAESGPNGEKWLKIQAEWINEALGECEGACDGTDPWNKTRSDRFCNMLQSGKSVVFCPEAQRHFDNASITSDKARTSAIVPILVDGDYVGVIGFDDWQRVREFDSSIVSALEIAAGLVGAALHRERLLDTMRRERELAAEERLTSAVRANALLRTNLTRLARDPDPREFVTNILIDATRQLDAAAAFTIGFDKEANLWRAFCHIEGGQIVPPPYQATATNDETALLEVLEQCREPSFHLLQPLDRIKWPGAADWHVRSGHQSVYLLPFVVGEQSVGCIGLVFKQCDPLIGERAELALAVAHQIMLCIGLKKLGMAAKDAAVLAERNRIGQEIHDGLAQGFTGILMQLGAAEEAMHECARNSPLPAILTRIRDLAREGLTEARRSVQALRPEQLKRQGLELALRALCERTSVEGRVKCHVNGSMNAEGLAPEKQHELLRIAQEAISNALRHAHPNNVFIELSEDDSRWLLTVRDDGRGMTLNPDLYAQQGYGLTNMRERSGAIGGKFSIESKPGEGTRVSVTLPRRKVAA